VPVRGARLDVTLARPDPKAAAVPEEPGALRVTRGFGSVTLVPGMLVGDAARWTRLLQLDEASRRTGVPLSNLGWSLAQGHAEPEPPIPGAIACLSAFFLVGVLGDAWLTRRALRRKRRDRFRPVRYPAAVLAASAGAFVLADRASQGDQHAQRVDIVDVAADGHARARTNLYVTRGQSGALDVEAEEGSLRSALPMSRTFRATTLLASRDPGAPLRHARLEVLSWEPVVVSTSWDAPRLPTITNGPDGPVPPASDAAMLIRGCPGCRSTTWGGDKVVIGLLQQSSYQVEGQDLLLVAWRHPLGPAIRVDGKLPQDDAITIVRYRLGETGTMEESEP
jgi:hypothetical protein